MVIRIELEKKFVEKTKKNTTNGEEEGGGGGCGGERALNEF